MQLQLESSPGSPGDRSLEVYYQPIRSLASGEIVGCEALARWNHPIHGPISPDLFIPLAEDTGLIDTLGRWVLKRSCEEASNWFKSTGREVAVSVNIAPQQFLSGQLPELVRATLVDTGLPAHLLKLEITERSLLEDREAELSALENLRALGVSIVIDDFGTGYSSFDYLIRFAVDEIKLDRSFIDRIDSDSHLRKVVHAMVSLAHNLEIGVTAEGIEREEQLLLLKGIQCDRGQGYLLQRWRPRESLPS